MANLALDFGNTHIKAASFTKEEMGPIRSFNNLVELLNEPNYVLTHSNVIISSVTNDHAVFIQNFENKINCILFAAETKIPLQNLYKSASTLGSDRLAAAIGAYKLYPNQNVLTIDCGTCIKYNFTNSQNQYIGGGISPGLQLRFKALNSYTAKLPLLQIDETFDKLIGENTNESILSGVINGALAEVDGIIDNYKKAYPNLFVVITGGDGDFFVKRLKNSIFGHPNLVLLGLNQILEIQLEKN